MKKTMKKRVIPALLTVLASTQVGAAGFQLWEQNASGLGSAYAGSAAIADNASTVFFNPAGMTRLPGVQVSAGLSAVGPSYRFHNEGSVGLTGTDGGNAGAWGVVPNGYVSWQLNDQMFVGLGVSSPFGLSTEYDGGWIGRSRSLKSEIRTLNVNPSLAYKLSERVSLGFGINYQQLNAEMTSQPAPAVAYRVKGDASSWGWNAGALFTLSPAMRVGVSYRSAIKHELEGDRSLAALNQSATANIKLPGTFILSVWQQVSDRWEAMGDFSYTGWNTLKQLVIYHPAPGTADIETFNYRNAWRLAWGAAYKNNDSWKTKFGIAYDRSPVTDTDRSARVPDNDRLWLSIGGQWRPGRDIAVDVGYAYLYVKNPSINQTVGATTLRGHYEDSAHVLGVQYSQGF